MSIENFSFIIETLGCKVNQYESAALAAILTERGNREAAAGEMCDVVIINTCAVTGEASRKSRQAVRRLMSAYPGAALAVCGCASGLEADWARELGAALVGGSGGRREFADKLERIMTGEASAPREAALMDADEAGADFERLPPAVSENRTRASLKIQDGCDNFCAYCVIPYVRGRVRSLPLREIGAAARELNTRGYREIVVTGIEISSYGKDLGKTGLTDALQAVAANAPQVRIRLSSLEPSILTPDFIAGLRGINGICPHFHLSLQSGCTATLQRMNRRYGAEEFIAAVQNLRQAFPNCGITGDLITGFPGETDAEFKETLNTLEICEFSGLHVFPYSKRQGTRAAAMPEQVPGVIRRERAKSARDVAARTREGFLSAQAGRTLEVLFETEHSGVCAGHSGNFCEVMVSGSGRRGQILPVKITGVKNDKLTGISIAE